MPKRMIVEAMIRLCRNMGIEIIAEGVETPEELSVIRGMGINLVQGYLLARPGFERLPALAYSLVAAKAPRRAAG